MVRFYDNWERLVEAMMHREQFRQLSLCDSLSSSPNSLSTVSSFSRSSNTRNKIGSFRLTPSPLHPDAVKLRLAESVNQGEKIGSRNMPAKKRNPIWKHLSIFRSFSLKGVKDREEGELKWAASHRSLHGLRPIGSVDNLDSKQRNEEIFEREDMAKRADETARILEQHTLKGHMESVLRAIRH